MHLTRCAASCDEEGALQALKGGGTGKRERETGYTALHYACQYGLSSLVEGLLDARADVDATTKDLILQGSVVQSGGQTPLHLATRNHEVEVVDLLLNRKADLTSVDYDGFTAAEVSKLLQIAAISELMPCEATVEALKEKQSRAKEASKLRAARQFKVPCHLRNAYTLEKVWSHDECIFVLNALKDAVAARELGWTTDRHTAYATTDFPCEEVPAVDAWVRESLFDRVFPKLAARHGWSTSEVYFRDLFFVKYADDGQAGLALHRDGSTVSFNVLLNKSTDFEGGGTYIEVDDRVYQIEQGDCFIHSGKLRHGGQPITKGERYILVAFLDIDRN